MTILIKGMDMPADPLHPIHATIYADVTVITGHGVGEFAQEAVPVPTPHGRLKDADRLLFVLEKNFGHTGGAATMKQLIEIASTIIEAEVEE